MKTIAFEDLRKSNIELARIKERLGIKSKSLNRIKIRENPEQYQMLLRTARRRFNTLFRKIDERKFEYTPLGEKK